MSVWSTVSLLAVAAASGALYYRFKAKNTEFREQTLRNQASLITDYLKTAPQGPFELPRDVTTGSRQITAGTPSSTGAAPCSLRLPE